MIRRYTLYIFHIIQLQVAQISHQLGSLVFGFGRIGGLAGSEF